MKIKEISIIMLFLVVGVLLGIISMHTPKPQTIGSDNFSAKQAATYIKNISQQPHDALEQTALKDVRTYIINQLEGMGLTTTVHTYDYHDEQFGDMKVNNVLSSIPGNNDSYILLVAHYDSSHGHRSAEAPGSHGAADDGYGVSTLLEIANVIKNNDKTRENGIKFLFTDAEEVDLVGAQKEVSENPAYFKNVGFVINVEARGVKGPAIMFETSNNNNKVIQFYRNANLPVAYSLAGDVYSKMPNGTDFTHFKEVGLNGINLAVLDSLDYYHTPRDNYSNISLTSIQHYGSQLLPLVNQYVYNSQYSDVNYFNSNQNAIYFTFLPNVFMSYSVNTGLLLAILLIIFLIASLYFFSSKKIIQLGNVLKWTAFLFIPMFIFLILGVGISYLLSLFTSIDFSLTYMPKVPLSFIIFMIILLIELLGFLWFTHKKKVSGHNLYFSSLIFNTLFLILFFIVLPGGSYLYFWPVLLGLITYFINYLLRERLLLSQLVIAFNILMGVLLIIPVLYLLYLALTIGALGIILLLAFFPLTIITASSKLIFKK